MIARQSALTYCFFVAVGTRQGAAHEIQRDQVVGIDVERLAALFDRLVGAAPEVENPSGNADDVEIQGIERAGFGQKGQRRVFIAAMPDTERQPDV